MTGWPRPDGLATAVAGPRPIEAVAGPDTRPLRSALWLGLAYLLTATLSLYLSRQPGSIATIWYPNALAVGVLLHLRSTRAALATWLSVACANLAANLVWNLDLPLAAAFLVANLAEIAMAVALLRRAGMHTANLRTPWTVLRLLLLGGVLPQVPGGLLGAWALGQRPDMSAADIWLQWFEGSVLGALSLLMLVCLWLRTPAAVRRRELLDWRLAAMLPVTIAVTLWALTTVRFPIIFISLPLLLGAMVLPMLPACVLTLVASVTGATALALGLFVPPPVQANWEHGFIYLAFAAAMLPAQLLASTMAALLDGRAALQARTAELEQANERLEHFVHMASHDLREPLNTMTQFGGLLQQDAGDALSADSREYLRLMSQAGQRMRHLLDDVLRHARLRAEEREPLVDVDLQRTVAEVLEVLAGSLASSRGRVDVGPLPVVRGHPSLLSLLFQNLLANALKFVPPGRQPVVIVRAERLAGGHVISVADNGIGIAEADIPRLFKPFSRLHPQRLYEGTGLGLSLCQQIAKAHGGRVELHATPGQGSCFSVFLPLSGGAGSEAGAGPR